MKLHCFPFRNFSSFNNSITRTENTETTHARDASQNASPAPDAQPENRRARRYFPSLLHKYLPKKKEPGTSAQAVMTIEEQTFEAVAQLLSRMGKNVLTTPRLNNMVQFYISHGFNALDQKFEQDLKNILPSQSKKELEMARDNAKANIIRSVHEHMISVVEMHCTQEAAEFFSRIDVLTPSTFGKKVQDYKNRGLNALDQRFEHIMQNLLPGQSPEEFERTRDSAKERLIQSIDEICRSEGWMLSRQEESNVKWESPAGPLLIKRGLSLQQLKLSKENEARGSYGSVSVFENENGDKLIGKISYNNMLDDQGNIVDDLAKEYEGYKTIYDVVEPHANLVNAYGIAHVTNEGKDERVLLMDAVPGATGEKAFDALRKSWNAGKISSAEYWGAIQFISRRLLDVTEHISKAGVVHNDIKPENFLVNKETGEPVVIDLGIWSRKDEKHSLGTRGFASPEAAERKGTDERSDVFTIGASLVSGVENPNKLPSKGLSRGASFKLDREGSMRRIRGNYSAETAYPRFINSVMAKDREDRANVEKAKGLAFLTESILDEDAAKEAIKNALSFASDEERKPIKEQWKKIKPQVVLSEEQRRNAQRMLDEFKNHPDLDGYAKLKNESKGNLELKDSLKNDIGDLRDLVEKGMARYAEELITKASWFEDVKRISETIPKTIKAGVSGNGVRIKGTDQNRDRDDQRSVRKAKLDLASFAKTDDLRLYADEAEAFLRKAGTLIGGIFDDDIAGQVQQVKERAAVARRMVEIVETDFSSPEKHENGNIQDRALELERQLIKIRQSRKANIQDRAVEIERLLGKRR